MIPLLLNESGQFASFLPVCAVVPVHLVKDVICFVCYPLLMSMMSLDLVE